jgi:hypothetical protein
LYRITTAFIYLHKSPTAARQIFRLMLSLRHRTDILPTSPAEIICRSSFRSVRRLWEAALGSTGCERKFFLTGVNQCPQNSALRF